MANSYNNKRYYWIKLRDNFMTSDSVDFLMGQKDGANYVVLYQMLCLKTINTNGELSRIIGEVIIPYDVDKIVRDTKWFTKDTVIVALELYKKLGLVFKNDNGNLVITDFAKMVGSETQSAIYKQEKKELENFQQDSNRYKILDNRDNILDINIYNIKEKEIYKEKEIDLFEKFWLAYPKKKNKGQVEKWFEKNEPSEKLVNEMISKLELLLQTQNWNKNNGQFIPYPSTWLNAKGWEDEIDENDTTTPTWLDKNIDQEKISEKELKEMENLLKEFK